MRGSTEGSWERGEIASKCVTQTPRFCREEDNARTKSQRQRLKALARARMQEKERAHKVGHCNSC